MIKKNSDRVEPAELEVFRRQIDGIDDEIVRLMRERISVVSRVGELKRRTNPGRCPIRPAREAEMLRRIIHKFHDSSFLPAAAAAMWRMIIGISTAVEGPLTLSVFTPEHDNDLFWMAREYFGPFVPVIRESHIKRVIGDVMDGKATVGIVPMLRSADTTFWWTNLMQSGTDQPKVFARIPFIYNGAPGRNAPSALAIARVTPEDSGDDKSLIVLEVEHNVSQTRLQTAFNNAKLDATWINIATLQPSSRHHLIEVKGFVHIEHPGMQNILNSLGTSILQHCFLGSYAVPVILGTGNTNESKANAKIAEAGKK